MMLNASRVISGEMKLFIPSFFHAAGFIFTSSVKLYAKTNRKDRAVEKSDMQSKLRRRLIINWRLSGLAKELNLIITALKHRTRIKSLAVHINFSIFSSFSPSLSILTPSTELNSRA